MRSLGKITPWVAAALFLLCARAKACHVAVHYSKAEIEAADIRLYKRDVQNRDLDTTRFDEKHPLLGEVLGNQQVFEQEFHDWKSHPYLFNREHPGLSRVLEGDMLYHKKHPFEPSTVTIPVEVLNPTHTGGPVPPGSVQPAGGSPGNGIHAGSVPEPASGVMALTALVVGLAAAVKRSRSNTRV